MDYMASLINNRQRNIVLVVGFIAGGVIEDLSRFKAKQEKLGKSLRFFLLHDRNKRAIRTEQTKSLAFFDQVIRVNFDSPRSIVEAIRPYESELYAATCRAEAQIPNFAKVVPHISYLKIPTSESLRWSTEKILMRRRFHAYDPEITPRYLVVKKIDGETLGKIEQKIGFPLIIKPSGLAQSLLVAIAYHKEELEKSIQKAYKKIKKLYAEAEGRGEPELLVEQFLEGNLYSIDAYVDSRGRPYFCPMVYVKTGRLIGFDDFFGYLQMTPTNLNPESIREAQRISARAIHALGLKNSTAHIELIKTENGWKIVELGPRIGGFRDDLYALAYGIDHTANDILIRIPRKPIVPKKIKGFAAAMKFFARDEGRIQKIGGIKKAQALDSFHSIAVNKKIGDRAVYAKHGGKSVFNIILFNKDRSNLLADIRRLEQIIKIEIEK